MSNTELLNQLLNLTIWKTKDDNENYEVSISGSVRNIRTKRMLNPSISSNGYYYVHLYKKQQHKKFKVHRLVAKAFLPNLINGDSIDHINNEKLDNTISNLRRCTCQQNQFNKKVYKHSTTGIKGVSFNKKINKWECYIRFNYKKIHLGCFDNLEDAKNARRIKANELYGIYRNECEKIII